MRLIDAEPFDFNKVVIPDGGPNFMRGYGLGAKHVCDEIAAAPTVDAVPIIRCRDCKRHKMVRINGAVVWRCPLRELDVAEDYWCADAIKEGENEEPRQTD